jgi:hypothetical protein
MVMIRDIMIEIDIVIIETDIMIMIEIIIIEDKLIISYFCNLFYYY